MTWGSKESMLVSDVGLSIYESQQSLTIFKCSIHGINSSVIPHHILGEMWYRSSGAHGYIVRCLDWDAVLEGQTPNPGFIRTWSQALELK